MSLNECLRSSGLQYLWFHQFWGVCQTLDNYVISLISQNLAVPTNNRISAVMRFMNNIFADLIFGKYLLSVTYRYWSQSNEIYRFSESGLFLCLVRGIPVFWQSFKKMSSCARWRGTHAAGGPNETFAASTLGDGLYSLVTWFLWHPRSNKIVVKSTLSFYQGRRGFHTHRAVTGLGSAMFVTESSIFASLITLHWIWFSESGG